MNRSLLHFNVANTVRNGFIKHIQNAVELLTTLDKNAKINQMYMWCAFCLCVKFKKDFKLIFNDIEGDLQYESLFGRVIRRTLDTFIYVKTILVR